MSNITSETPLLDLLKSVPADARMIYEHSMFESSSIPVGVLAKRAADALTAQAAEVADLTDVLRRNGFVPCHIAACNCGSWHARYGLPERMAEVKEALSEAGHPLCNENGNLVSRSLQALIAERDAQAATIAEQAAELEAMRERLDFHVAFTREAQDLCLAAQAATIAEQAAQLEALRADAERHSKATLMLSGMFSRNCMAMQAALADMMLRGHEQGWQWIINSLDGPGLLPDMAEVKAAGGAQAWFDAELAEEEARVAAMQSGKAGVPHDNRKCSKPKCNGNMRPGTYLEQTFSGVPDFPGDAHAVTVSPAGPGRLAECLKCDACGHSVTAGKAVTP